MNLNDFEAYADTEFAQHLPAIADADEDADVQGIHDGLFPRLERKAIEEGVEVCQRMSWLLVLALYDCYLHTHAERLLVGPEYFDGDRPEEDEAHDYLLERRLGGPARHNHLSVC